MRLIDLDDDRVVEALAVAEHDSWARWQRHLHKLCVRNDDGSLVIPAERVAHWEQRIAMPFRDLPGYSQEADRKEVRRALAALASLAVPSTEG